MARHFFKIRHKESAQLHYVPLKAVLYKVGRSIQADLTILDADLPPVLFSVVAQNGTYEIQTANGKKKKTWANSCWVFSVIETRVHQIASCICLTLSLLVFIYGFVLSGTRSFASELYEEFRTPRSKPNISRQSLPYAGPIATTLFKHPEKFKFDFRLSQVPAPVQNIKLNFTLHGKAMENLKGICELNGQQLKEELSLGSLGKSEQVELPREHLRLGLNEIDLDFRGQGASLKITDIYVGSLKGLKRNLMRMEHSLKKQLQLAQSNSKFLPSAMELFQEYKRWPKIKMTKKDDGAKNEFDILLLSLFRKHASFLIREIERARQLGQHTKAQNQYDLLSYIKKEVEDVQDS